RRDVVLASAFPTTQALYMNHERSPYVLDALRAPRAEDRSSAAHRSGIGTWLLRFPERAGCRGVKGPVPRPLSMSALARDCSTARLPYPRVMAAQRARVSVCLPARNEAATVGEIVERAAASPVVDEVVVIDDGSTDATREVAAGAGATVVDEAALLPEAGPGS